MAASEEKGIRSQKLMRWDREVRTATRVLKMTMMTSWMGSSQRRKSGRMNKMTSAPREARRDRLRQGLGLQDSQRNLKKAENGRLLSMKAGKISLSPSRRKRNASPSPKSSKILIKSRLATDSWVRSSIRTYT